MRGPAARGRRSHAGFYVLALQAARCRPIIEAYQNASMGHASTEAEAQWLEADAQRIREDVLAGRWTPLGEGKDHLS